MEKSYLTIWQIDSFEGGKGSRADYLKKLGAEFAESENCYINVIQISSDAAKLNISGGKYPDIISYGAGEYGLENIIDGYSCWCYGSYCILTLDSNADFADVSIQNTIVNAGKSNLSAVAALFCGLKDAVFEKCTGAYVKLINGNYKYLLGTQRDIFRLKSRQVAFSVKPITQFNDLYQNISVTTKCVDKNLAKKYISKVLSHSDKVNKIGMFYKGYKLYDDEMGRLEGLDYEYNVISPITEQFMGQIWDATTNGDINMLKSLLK